MDAKPAKSPLDPQTDLANTCCEDKPANRKEYLSMVGSLMYAALGSRPDCWNCFSPLSAPAWRAGGSVTTATASTGSW